MGLDVRPRSTLKCSYLMRYLMAVTKEKYLRLQQGDLAKGTGACHCSTFTKNILWIYSLLIKKRRPGGAQLHMFLFQKFIYK